VFPFISDVRIWQTRWHIWNGDLAGAERTLALLAQSEQDLSTLQQETIHLLRARLHLARGEAEAAFPLLERILSEAEARRHFTRVLEIQLLIALAYAARKQGQEARRQILLVLAQARNEGFLRLFLDEGEPLAALLRQLLPTLTKKPLRTYVQSLLSAFTNALLPPAKDVHATEGLPLEPLSTQEQRVLTLLVAGHSNPEIADILVISVNTVKGHVKNLYRKLGVSNRMQASSVARHVRLV
jgi:LuxR family maltose regulon positive regulatory protein